jgi:hypothetical protein
MASDAAIPASDERNMIVSWCMSVEWTKSDRDLPHHLTQCVAPAQHPTAKEAPVCPL